MTSDDEAFAKARAKQGRDARPPAGGVENPALEELSLPRERVPEAVAGPTPTPGAGVENPALEELSIPQERVLEPVAGPTPTPGSAAGAAAAQDWAVAHPLGDVPGGAGAAGMRVLENVDGTKELLFDTDGDGRPDEVATIPAGGPAARGDRAHGPLEPAPDRGFAGEVGAPEVDRAEAQARLLQECATIFVDKVSDARQEKAYAELFKLQEDLRGREAGGGERFPENPAGMLVRERWRYMEAWSPDRPPERLFESASLVGFGSQAASALLSERGRPQLNESRSMYEVDEYVFFNFSRMRELRGSTLKYAAVRYRLNPATGLLECIGLEAGVDCN